MIAGMLVFIMHLGFATLESGLTRSKNTVNILFKNTMIICIGLLTYGICGFNLMYPGFDGDIHEHSETGKLTTEFEDGGVFAFAGFGFLANGNELATAPARPEMPEKPGDDVTGDAREVAMARYDEALSAYNEAIKDFDPVAHEKAVTAFNANTTQEYAGYTLFTDFFFQAMFAATCCTIVSGAVAGRIKLSSFLIFATLFVTLSYPITGSWHWGAGWLNRLGFYDFAGSTLVHSVGGWGALVMAILLGARKGKYVDGEVKAMPASSMPLAAIGVFLLWFGWFGFNGGSVLNADPGLVSLTLVTTTMAAAAGGFSAAMTSWVHSSKPDLSMSLNGILAGLVGITAGADQMSGLDAIFIGLIAGVIVYFAVIFIDTKLKIDDPVGAISVHLMCGIWGTLCVGIFGAKGFLSGAGMGQLTNQLIGIVAIGAFTVVFCLIVGLTLKSTVGLRVSPEEEEKGLDIGEHGMQAYAH
ncbi:MAG: ammonium transporter [Planctomycetota bacterium]|nr:ammonium transporter [Planctomycetota bacterium]